MSILDSREEVAAAEAQLADASDEQLVTDLQYWTVAAADASADYIELHKRQLAVGTLHSEARNWVELVVAEIRRRRDARRSGADG